MQVNQHLTVEGYVERLRQEPQEVNALFRDLLINVTNLFRDADAFESLAVSVIPKLFEGRGAEDSVVYGCPAARPAKKCSLLQCCFASISTSFR
jgi:two-component system CheB/CheR fusion protein